VFNEELHAESLSPEIENFPFEAQNTLVELFMKTTQID
jgi:hypothetical protein